MRLVVIGAYPLDVLQQSVVECFSDIPALSSALPIQEQTQQIQGQQSKPDRPPSQYWEETYDSPLRSYGMPLTEESSLRKVFYIAPVKDRHSLSVTWQIPSQTDQWRSKPCDYLAHLIGHEAQGSILASLKAKSWATACCAGVGSEGFEVRCRTGFSFSYKCLTGTTLPNNHSFAVENDRMHLPMPSLRFPSPFRKKG